MLFTSFGLEMLNGTVFFRVENLTSFPSGMAPLSFTGPINCNAMTSFPPLFFPLNYNNSHHISLATKLPRNNVHVHGNSLSPFSYQCCFLHRNLYSEGQRVTSLIALDAKNSESGGENNEALDAVMKLYSAFKNKNTHELSEILADERRWVRSFLSFFRAFQGKTRVLEFFAYLTRILGKDIEIAVKPTLQDGMNGGVRWKFEWNKIQFPFGKGFSIHIRRKAVQFRNIEMFMEPLLHFEPFRLKMTACLTELAEKISSIRVAKSGKKAKRTLCIVLAVLSLAALLFFMKLAS